MRDFFLACSTSPWLRERATRYGFVQRAVSRFMPGETPSDAIGAALALRDRSIGAMFTYLGENVSDPAEAQSVTEHYLDLLDRIRKSGLGAEVSVKLTQLGLDLSAELCHANLKRIIEHADPKVVVWVDMEASNYVDRTLELYRRARAVYPNVGVCLQAYLHRTAKDLESLLPIAPAIRLVKGAYNEPAGVAFPKKRDVDESYRQLAQRLLAEAARQRGKPVFGTHDLGLIEWIRKAAADKRVDPSSYEFHMLYGIRAAEQRKLASTGAEVRVLISYGSAWFAWYMRRLAERPANVWFVLRNVV